MSDPGSISLKLSELRRGDQVALERICDRYYDRLAAIAHRKLMGKPLRVVDEFAVANEALQEFYSRACRGEFDNVTTRGDLLPVLIRLTHDRVVDQVRRELAQKRGSGKTRGHSVFARRGKEPDGDFDAIRGALDSPSTRQIVADELRSVLAKLPDEAMRTIVLLRADGYTDQEIARELDISLATVERKRRRVKLLLAEAN